MARDRLLEALKDIEPLLKEVATWPPGSSFGASMTHGSVSMTSDQAQEILRAMDEESEP